MICKKVKSKRQIKEFINFPNMLYKRNENTRDKKTETQILKGRHILSKYFKVIGLLVYNDKDRVVGRCIVTIYENDDKAYFGFFDSINNKQVVERLMEKAEEIANESGKNELVGPLDSSFWIGYRLKIDDRKEIYTCEPYNKSYYLKRLKEVGFHVCERYISNKYRVPTEKDINLKYNKRLEKMIEDGYVVVIPCFWYFNRQLRDIYGLLTKLYSSFPCYKSIEENEFYSMFKGLRYILKYDMVKLVYKDGELKGFMVNIPNYGYKIRLRDIIKRDFKEYVLLYMGVDRDSLGVGSALAEITKRELCKRGCKSIGALIHEGKVSGSFYKELIEYRYEYVLLNKKIES